MAKHFDTDWPVFEEKGEENESVREIIYDVRDDEDTPITDNLGRTYTYVGEFLNDEDFYQGLNKTTVIRRDSDGVLFGYFWWDDISKHGESYVESNGDEYGIECDYHADDFDWENDYVSYYIWVPVEEFAIKGYRANV